MLATLARLLGLSTLRVASKQTAVREAADTLQNSQAPDTRFSLNSAGSLNNVAGSTNSSGAELAPQNAALTRTEATRSQKNAVEKRQLQTREVFLSTSSPEATVNTLVAATATFIKRSTAGSSSLPDTDKISVVPGGTVVFAEGVRMGDHLKLVDASLEGQMLEMAWFIYAPHWRPKQKEA